MSSVRGMGWLVLIAIGISSSTYCRKSVVAADLPVSGLWKLRSYQFSVGGPTSDSIIPLNKTISLYLHQDGSYTSDFFPGGSGDYSVLSDSTLHVSSAGWNLYPLNYVVTDSTLVITPGCFEGCSYSYTKVHG